MSRRAWLTPDEIPSGVNCFQVLVPDSLEFEAVFRGALLLLADVWNWEQNGTLTAEQCAEHWFSLLETSLNMTPCATGGEMITGSIFWYPSATPPSGALVCDGSVYDTSLYPELFAVVGYDWGGSGSSFAVPDLRDQFILGKGGSTSPGDTGGESEVTLTVNQMPAHVHAIKKGVSSGGLPVPGVNVAPRFDSTIDTEQAGSGFPHNNLPPFTVLVPMIVAS